MRRRGLMKRSKTNQELDGMVLIAIRRVLAAEIHTSETVSRKFTKNSFVAARSRSAPGGS